MERYADGGWQEINVGLSFQVLGSFTQSIWVSNDHPVIFVSTVTLLAIGPPMTYDDRPSSAKHCG